MQINSLSSNFILSNLNNTQAELGLRLAKLSSALRINSAADDAAGLAISEGLRTQVNGLDQASRNALDGISVLQTAEGGMQEIQDMAQRVRTLSVQAANDTLTDSDRALIQREVTQLTQEIDRFAGTVNYNGQPLLDGSRATGAQPVTLHVGANQDQTVSLGISAMTTTGLGINGIDVSTRAGAEAAIGRLDTAISGVSEQRATLGAQQNRLTATINFVQLQNENTTASESRIRDADMATEMIGFTLAQMREQSGTAMLSHSFASQQSVLNLLR